MSNATTSSQGTISAFAYVAGCILFTVYGQLIVKWQVSKAGLLPETLFAKAGFLIHLLLNPWVMSGMAAGFFAMLCWLAAMTKFELSYAYPFMSLAFVLVLVMGTLLFHEALTVPKVLGILLIVMGIIVSSRG
jgi:multidrug transporter EmrE-like cation transporter